MFRETEIGKRVVVKRVSNGNLEIGEIFTIFPGENRVRVRITSIPNPDLYRNFNTITGLSLDDEGRWKMLDEYDLAVKEVGRECPHCGVLQRNFFMANEFLQNGKNLNCYSCGKLLWLDLEGNTKKVTGD